MLGRNVVPTVKKRGKAIRLSQLPSEEKIKIFAKDMPTGGLEPSITRLKVERITDYAKWAALKTKK